MHTHIYMSAAIASLVLAGCATNGSQGVAAVNGPPTAKDAAQTSNNLACQTATASRIPLTVGGVPCASPGHTFTAEDLRTTGATTSAEALRLLDPTLTINH